jgi:D-lactate dehydrogenase
MIKAALERIIPAQRVKTSLTDRLAYASDAGFYYLVPQAVVQPLTELETKLLFDFSVEWSIPLVFRGISRGWSKSAKAFRE